MKNILVLFTLLFSLIAPQVLIPTHAGAANVFSKACNGRPDSSVCQEEKNGDKKNPFINIIRAAINLLSLLVGIAAVIGIIISGIRLMLAGGNAESVASARSGLIYSLVGVAIVALAQTIVAFVLNRF